MCGIAGIFAIEGGARPDRAELARMIGALAHRGPDGNGLLVDGPVGLAHARLSIIDLAGGQQPIYNEDCSVSVVFNGEIFNYVELRAALQSRGHRFKTNSDTEVIVHLYEDHGDGFVEHLNGQFAIALWDATRRRLVLARDRTGIRPLFYARAAGRLVFASEVKALFALPDVTPALDPAGLGQVFTYWAPLAPSSVFAGVLSLPPGHVLVAQEAQAVRVSRYWDWSFPKCGEHERRPIEEVAEELRELLIDAVRLQLRADVPVGAYLSGGLDSAIVTSIIKNFTATPLRTFSLTFEDAEFDESAHQRALVEYLGTDHTSVQCSRSDIARLFPRTILHVETPIVRTAAAPLMLLSDCVRQNGYKVVLTGEGADEVFGGYDIFKEAKVRRFWARAPQSELRPRALERLYPYLKHSPTAARVFSQGFFKQGMEHVDAPYFAHIPRWTTTRRIWQFFSPDMRAALTDADPLRDVERILPPGMMRWAPMSRDQYVEAHTLMSGYLLSAQGDRVAMANSIEGRFPFLDHRLIEFANRLPPHYKLWGLREKHVLKKAMQGLLPEGVRLRTKQPYRAPDSASFFFNGRPVDYIQDLLSPARLRYAGYFDPVAVGKLVEKCRAGRAIGFGDNMAFVGILSTMLVDELIVRRRLDTANNQSPSPVAVAA